METKEKEDQVKLEKEREYMGKGTVPKIVVPPPEITEP
jgi:hypothetical protein